MNRLWAIVLALVFGFAGGAGSTQPSSSKRMADSREWTTANLNVNASSSYCYDDDERHCRQYGRLYTWASAQRVCQSLGAGWRLPTDDEWRQMAKRYGGISSDSADEGKAAFTALMSGGSSDFNAVLGGNRLAGKYERLEAHGMYWTASDNDSATAPFYNFGKNSGALHRQPSGQKEMAISVRCVRESATAASQAIRQIDHIMIRTGTPQELYAFFTETLELPVAWPITSPRAGVVTGGVGVGNVNVEAIQFPGQTESRPRLVGFALEPSGLDASLSELNRRGITSGERRPLIAVGADGSKNTLWTNVTLSQFSDADSPANATLHIFLSEYNASYVNVEERHARLRKQLIERNGGPLGVIDVKEVIIGASGLQMARELWQRLLDPVRSAASNTWAVGNGPAIRLVSAAEDRVQTMVIRVASLDRAKAFLRDRQLLGAESAGEISIDPSKVGGLDIRLVGK